MRYVLLSTPGGHEWEHPLDLIVDTRREAYMELWAYEPNDSFLAGLNDGTIPDWRFSWTPLAQYEPSEHWAEHHGETFEETTARLFNDLPTGKETQKQ